jgi:SAM-dependent methyltransferase
VDNPYEKRDERFARFKAKDPTLTFGRYMAERMQAELASGKIGNPKGAIPVALGPDFWSAGEARARKLLSAIAPRPDSKVIDYGCGSLRIGAHFIARLARGCYFGLDVIEGFYGFGRQALGPALLEEKAPRFHIIDEAGLTMGEAFGADIVFSNVVCIHIHPDETTDYFRNLARLAHKPGARLLFNARTTEAPVRYEFDGWSWPMTFYTEALPGFELVRADRGVPQFQNGIQTLPVDFEFRRM